jgi:hypothetical protein
MEVELAGARPRGMDALLVLLAIVLGAIGAYLLLSNVGNQQGITGWALLLVALALLFPRLRLGLRLTDRALEVDVVTGTRSFPCGELGDARVVDGTLWLRRLGVSAAGYHTGWFRISDHGRVKAYASTFKGPFVLIERHEGAPLLLSPEDPQAFMEAYRVKRRAGR